MTEKFIEFEGKEYLENQFIPHEGKIYARVSAVLSHLNDFSAINPDVLNAKAILGTRVHDHIKQEIEGNFPVVAGKERGYFSSFQKWRDALTPTFIQSEVRYYCDKKMITGCIDALIKLEGEEKSILVDWKTSAQESPVVWPVQAHLYHYLITSTGTEIAPRMLFVKLDKDGDYPKVFQYRFRQDSLDICFHHIEKFWKKWR